MSRHLILLSTVAGATLLACSQKKPAQRDAADSAAELADSAAPSASGACAGRSAADCLVLARKHTTGRGATLDHRKAASLFEGACGLGSSAACAELGRASWDGRGAAFSTERSRQLLSQACDKSSAEGCAYLVQFHLEPRNREHDLKQARSVALKACELGSGLGCRMAADLGLGADLSQADALPFYRKARTLLETACEGTELGACQQLSDALAAPLNSEADFLGALKALGRGCELGHVASCDQLERVLGYGVYGPADAAGAAAAAKSAASARKTQCDAGDLGNCNAIAMRGYVIATPDAIAAAKRVCKSGSPLGCYYAAWEKGESAGKAAADYLAKACESRDPGACFDLAMQREQGGNREGAAKLMASACSLGDPTACSAFMDPRLEPWRALAKPGLQLIVDVEVGACKAGEAAACVSALTMRPQLEAQSITAHDSVATPSWLLARARSLANDSCTRGSAKGCQLAAIVLGWAPDADHAAANAAGALACEQGLMRSCERLAETYAADRDKSVEYRRRTVEVGQKGCDAGWQPACDALHDLAERQRGSAKP